MKCSLHAMALVRWLFGLHESLCRGTVLGDSMGLIDSSNSTNGSIICDWEADSRGR